MVIFGLSVMMLKSLRLSLTISVTLILFICYLAKEAHNATFKRELGCSPPSIAYFHSLLLPFLVIGLCLPLLIVSPDVHPVLFILDIHMNTGGGPSTYIYCVVCYHTIAAPYVRSIVISLHTVTLDNWECPMHY